MAAATKTARTFQASASNAADATATGTGVNLTTALGCVITARITNGATGPTVACDVSIEVSNDNTAWREFSRARAGVANNGVYDFPFVLPKEVMYARTVFVGNTGQAVTVEALGHEFTSIA